MESDKGSSEENYSTIDDDETDCELDETDKNCEDDPLGAVSSKKRQRRPETHKRNISKENVQRGNARTTKSGKFIPAKIFEFFKCGCRLKCDEKIDNQRQKEIFDLYYKNSNATEKTLILRQLITMSPVIKKRDKYLPLTPLKKREYNYTYQITDNEGAAHEVCRPFVIGVLQVPPSRLYRAIQSAKSNPSGLDRRGRAPAKNKTSEESKQGVRDFIILYPKCESQLNPNLNLTQMFKLYKESCATKKIQSVSEYMFRDIFNSEFNLDYHPRPKDIV